MRGCWIEMAGDHNISLFLGQYCGNLIVAFDYTPSINVGGGLLAALQILAFSEGQSTSVEVVEVSGRWECCEGNWSSFQSWPR